MADNQITSYSFHSNKIRTLTDAHNEIVFCLADVCKSLDLGQVNKTAAQIKEEFGCTELNSAHVTDALGRDQEATFITEPQLYFVMMRSRAKVAREFRQWIVNEVLPSIRKTGAYKQESQGKQGNATQGVSAEDVKKLASMSWNANKIFTALEGKVDTQTTLECVNVAATSWRQGYAVACKKKEKEIAELREKNSALQQALDEKSKVSEATDTVNYADGVPVAELLTLAQGYAALGSKALQLLKEERLGHQSITLK